MYPWLQQAVDEGADVVTASRRLSRELRQSFDLAQLERGRSAWLTPPVYPWQAWLMRLAANATNPDDDPIRLGTAACTVLWEQCLKSHPPEAVLSARGVVTQAARAWQCIQDWQVPIDRVSSDARSQDERWFARAARQYQSVLAGNGWEDSALLTARVTELISRRRIEVPDRVVYAGFDRLVPAVERLFEAMREAGCDVQSIAHNDGDTAVRIGVFDTAEAELRAAGAWARRQLLDRPESNVAIVTATLEADAVRTARLVREGVAPGWQIGSALHRRAVDVSYGRRLAEYPAIAVALLALRWTYSALASREVSQLLRSDHIGGGDSGGRSRLEIELRRIPDRSWDVRALRSALSRVGKRSSTGDWLQRAARIGELADRSTSAASPAHWAGTFARLLDELGWPGERSQSSDDFQLVNRWRDLLNEFAATGIVTPKIDLGAAVRRLCAMAAETVFQPEGQDGLVRVLGALEAAGMTFDAVWIAGLEARQWPPPGTPSSLVSRDLQRQYGMPDASPADTLDYARRVLDRLVASAGIVALSWPRFDGESELAPSALLDRYDGAPLQQADPGWFAAELAGSAAALQRIDESAPAIRADEHLAGGAYTVQRHTREPFQSFAYGRLRVKDLQRFQPGLPARLRGNIIHSALRNLYAHRPSREQVRDWRDKELQERIGGAVDSALGDELRHADAVLRHLISLERRRLRRMLLGFHAHQVELPEFTVVGVEEEFGLERLGVRLRLRIDRLDRIADGSILISDYKTGAPKSLLDRDGDISDLQLVVYTCALEEPAGGVALINVDSRDISVRALTGSEDWVDNWCDDWPQRLAAWQDEVDAVLGEIAAGDVHVNVAIPAADGRPLAVLSRVEELRRAE